MYSEIPVIVYLNAFLYYMPFVQINYSDIKFHAFLFISSKIFDKIMHFLQLF